MRIKQLLLCFKHIQCIINDIHVLKMCMKKYNVQKPKNIFLLLSLLLSLHFLFYFIYLFIIFLDKIRSVLTSFL